MKSFWQNLRPHEQRLVVIVGLVVFVLLNVLFVTPYFADWTKVHVDIARNRSMLSRFNTEIARRPLYEKRQTELEATGSDMLTSETEFQRIITGQAAATRVQISSLVPSRSSSSKTNQFFQEGAFSVQFTAGGKELVDFLVGIAAQNSMIRVRNMNVHPADPNQTRLGGNILFVGNYQRPSTNRPSPSVTAANTGKTATPAAKNKPASTKPPAKAPATGSPHPKNT
jgi:hypothetical protein